VGSGNARRPTRILKEKNMKKLSKIMIVGAAVFLLSGCTSTLVVGKKANKDGCLKASAGWDHLGVTLPLVKARTELHKE
jgi:uncharacterized lipoprotein YajG